mgnify:FL=1
MKKNILVVSGFFPYPTLFGGTFDIWERTKGLCQLGHKVDILYTDKAFPKEKDLAVVKSFVGKIYRAQRKNSIFQLFDKSPLQVLSRKTLEHIKLEDKYDIIILETEYVGRVLRNKTLRGDKVYLRVQNNEQKYFSNLSKSTANPLRKLYFFQESLKFKWYSKFIFNYADRLWFISSTEEMEYHKLTNSNKSIHLPSPINGGFVKQKLDNNNVLFIGSLFMDNNIQGLMWYLDNIHDDVYANLPDYSLHIYGSTGVYSEKQFIKKFKKYRRIHLHLNLENIEEAYKNTSVFINPMLQGAGVKLKSINAIVNGLPLVATSTGSEGIGLVDKEMFYLANTPKDFFNAIVLALKSTNKEGVVEAAQNHLNSNNYLKILESELK